MAILKKTLAHKKYLHYWLNSIVEFIILEKMHYINLTILEQVWLSSKTAILLPNEYREVNWDSILQVFKHPCGFM